MFFFVFHLNYFELTTFVDRQTPSLTCNTSHLLVILNKSFAVQFFLCKLASVGQLSQTLSSLSTIQGLELIAEVRRSPSNELILAIPEISFLDRILNESRLSAYPLQSFLMFLPV